MRGKTALFGKSRKSRVRIAKRGGVGWTLYADRFLKTRSDKGWWMGLGGGLALVAVGGRKLPFAGLCPPSRDKRKAPAPAAHRPLSLRNNFCNVRDTRCTNYFVRFLLCSILGCWMVLASNVAGVQAGGGALALHAAWASSMYQLLPPLGSNYSCRFIARASLGGRAVRIRLSNLMGTSPLVFGAVFAGLRTTGAALSTNVPVTFHSSTAVTIPPGRELSSDPVPLAVAAGQDLAVSVYVPGNNEPVTDHVKSFVTSYCTNTQGGGNQAAALSGASYTHPVYDMYWLTAVDVYGLASGTIVTLGDSITNGSASTYDGNNRWTDVLSRRLLAEPAQYVKSVANASISGNEICASNPYDGSPSALARLKRDVLHQADVTHVILFEGTNDLAYGGQLHVGLSADDVIACMKGIIGRVHATGLTIIGATIIPRSFDSARESARQQVNAWIRTSRAFDGMIDFDAVVRDPNNPANIAPAYDSGDHIHPNPAGHVAMGNAITVSLFK